MPSIFESSATLIRTHRIFVTRVFHVGCRRIYVRSAAQGFNPESKRDLVTALIYEDPVFGASGACSGVIAFEPDLI
jgi:hypothetical protein